MNDPNEDDVDEIEAQFEAMNERLGEMTEECRYRSADALALEMRRTAKGERRLVEYLNATFSAMNHCSELQQPKRRCEYALELIGLLESEERARTIQADYPEDEYEYTKSWMTACAYDNLAQGTGQIRGFNSEGMHQCIQDGIAVCHRTGKLQCITCFREYANEVYAAADDREMAAHFARLGTKAKPDSDSDRRYVSHRDLMRHHLGNGELEKAWDEAVKAWHFTDTYHSPYSAKVRFRWEMLEVACLLGDPSKARQYVDHFPLDTAGSYFGGPPAGEDPDHEENMARARACEAAMQGKYAEAIAMLEPWERVLRENEYLSDWFDIRLRIIALHKMAGNAAQVTALADSLREKAKPARDWATLKLLDRLVDSAVPAVPVPSHGDYTAGPLAPKAEAAAWATVVDTPPSLESADTNVAHLKVEHDPLSPEMQAEIERVASPLDEFIGETGERMQNAFESAPEEVEGKLAEIASSIIELDPKSLTDETHRCWLMYFLLGAAPAHPDPKAVWAWTKAVSQPHAQHPATLNLLASIADSLRSMENSPIAAQVSDEQVEKWFRKSLELDPDAPRGHLRAGNYFMAKGDVGEAERCYARGFRLQRDNAELAERLAEVYRQTDRAADALAVLDMAVREGAEHPDILWNATLLAMGEEQYEGALAYLDRYESMMPNQPWANYFRSAALIELQRFAPALESIQKEAENNPDAPLPVAMVEAACLANLGRPAAPAAIEYALDMPLHEADYMTRTGLGSVLSRLWHGSRKLPADHPLRAKVDEHVVRAGLAPDEMFDEVRQKNRSARNVRLHVCHLRQPLSEQWNSDPCRLPSEEGWEAYVVRWGVLARNEEEATRFAMEWQNRYSPMAAELLHIDVDEENEFNDRIGVVWQGERENAAEHDNAFVEEG